jgi:predicted nucleic acid-binding protein
LAWSETNTSPLVLSVLTEYELGNALRFAEYRKILSRGAAAIFWAQFAADQAQGRISIPVCNLADIVEEAKRLSATYTLTGGHRGFDILHVAVAIKLGAEKFLTFDANQKKLAAAEGLDVPL